MNMYTTVRGIYENGQISLYEQPSIESLTEVLVTFTKEIDTPIKLEQSSVERKAGFGKGTVLFVSDNFDEPIDDIFNVFK